MHGEDVRTDEDLAISVQRGDHDSFEELMKRYEARLFRYGNRFLSRNEDIQDVVQDVFIKTYENIQSYDPSYRFSPWIYRIAHNTFVNVLRKNSHRSFEFIDFDTLISPLSVRSLGDDLPLTREELERSMDELDVKYREILILHYFEELSYDEIRDVLHIPLGTIGVRLKRAREALRKVYETKNKTRS